jgi:TPR repeat protein
MESPLIDLSLAAAPLISAILAIALFVILRPRTAQGREMDPGEFPQMVRDDLPSVIRALQDVGVAPVELLNGVFIDVAGEARFHFGHILPPGLRPAYEKARSAIDPGDLDPGPLMAELVGPITEGVARGEPDMALLLAHLHLRGLGVPDDADEALRLVRLAAGTGDLVAAIILGEMLLNGIGTLPDFDEAVVWLRRALPLGGNKPRLGLWYARVFRPDLVSEAEAVGSVVTAFSRGDKHAGFAMERNALVFCPTLDELRLAAKAGDPGMWHMLGTRLLFGPPEERDEAEGLAALLEAASWRDDAAARFLSRIYREGVPGVPRDEAEADKWALAAKMFKEERLSREASPEPPPRGARPEAGRGPAGRGEPAKARSPENPGKGGNPAPRITPPTIEAPGPADNAHDHRGRGPRR